MQVITASLLLLAIVVPAFAVLTCYQCNSTQGDCLSGSCDGFWCTASITENKATRTRTVNKGCASVNPSGSKEDGCAKDTAPDGTDTYRCGCSKENNCNSEGGIARMQAMLSNQFSLPGSPNSPAGTGGAAVGTGPVAGTGSASFPNNQQPGGQPGNGQLPQIPPGLINPNSSFTDVLSGQPNPFPGQPIQPGQPGQPGQSGQPGLVQSGQPQPGQNPGGPQQPTAGGPNGGQPNPAFPPNNNQPFPQGGPNVPPSPNQNKPVGARPMPGHETDNAFASGPNGIPPNTNTIDVHTGLSTNDSSRPGDSRQPPPTNDLSGNTSGQSRSGPILAKNGARTCACTEPSCNGPCKGEVCFMMAFSANDVHSQAFAGKQGQIIQSGCTDDMSVLAEGSHHAQRQIPNYKFKINGQEMTVPASATYCNDGDFCNGAASFMANASVLIAVVSLVATFLMRH